MVAPRLAFLFAALGMALMAIAFFHGRWFLFVCWLGLDFCLIAAAYLLAAPAVFGKKTTGRLPLWSKMVFLPYFLYTLAIWRLARLLSREAILNPVKDGIVVGRRLLSPELDQPFDAVVDLTAEFEEPSALRNHPGYRNFPILDAAAPSPIALRESIQSVPPGAVFIHCAQGHGRTGLFALALLLHRGIAPTIEEGLALLQAARPGISLNSVQMDCIKRYLK